jgi:cysteine-rich repeat protein
MLPTACTNACTLCGNGAVTPPEECDDGGTVSGDGCSASCELGCPATPDAGCVSTFAKGLLLASETVPGKEKVLAKWIKGPNLAGADFGNPLDEEGTVYVTCLYDGTGTLAATYEVSRAGALCDGKDCWKPLGVPGTPKHQGYKYKDKGLEADGTFLLQIRGPGAAKALLKGKNNSSMGQVSLPTGVAAALAGSSSATMQLHGSDAAVCLSVDLPTVVKDTGVQFKAKKP